MKDYHGKTHLVKSLGLVSMDEFENAYNDMSLSSDKLPVASTVIPAGVNSNGKPGFYAWIFYEVSEKTVQAEEKKLEEAETKLEMD